MMSSSPSPPVSFAPSTSDADFAALVVAAATGGEGIVGEEGGSGGGGAVPMLQQQQQQQQQQDGNNNNHHHVLAMGGNRQPSSSSSFFVPSSAVSIVSPPSFAAGAGAGDEKPSSPTSCFICGDLSMPSTAHLYRHLLSHSHPDLAMAVISLSEQQMRDGGSSSGATQGEFGAQRQGAGSHDFFRWCTRPYGHFICFFFF